MKKTILILAAVAVVIASVSLGFFFGRKFQRSKVEETLPVVVNVNRSELTEWQIMELAIIKTESEFNPLAVGKTNDVGIFQITPIYVKEVNRIVGEEAFTHNDALDESKSVAMFSIMQNKYNPAKDIDRAIRSHNPTADISYSVKVKKNMDFIREYEKIRSLVKDN